jgi:hypothetical protein
MGGGEGTANKKLGQKKRNKYLHFSEVAITRA